MTNTYQLTFSDLRTYGFAALFVAGNIVLPQICHLVPKGGLIFLPIYFFTLIGAFRYGFSVGLLTAVLSPLVNNLLFGMPPAGSIVAILVKSVSLAGAAAFFSAKFKGKMFVAIVLTVLSYQIIGGGYELIFKGLQSAIQDFRIGWIGILLQIFLGYAVLKSWKKSDERNS